MGDRATKAALFDGFADIAKALANGRRAELIDVLGRGERHVDELADEIGQSVANTSFHYAAGHIAGARSIPADRLARELRTLPADVEVVAYCRGPYCVLADEAVRLLRRRGRAGRRLEDGFPEWRDANLSVQSLPVPEVTS